ncbi:S-methyl-5-thioribose kinase [Clostridium sp. ATCC 25772]|uniref:S-methyl-5-thioribose kinase n=1 Tax=Clostridium sp. ATCC 25772 TaxID=1676991 RepID=UPI00078229D5|nr:S-methyl-5-thioribose kinase [Clostridium sp. ATCC 25772]
MKIYKEMNNESIVQYIKELEIFPKNHKLISEEIGDGNLNYVFRVKDVNTNKTIIVKQALPYLKIAGDGWKLTLDRNRIEAEAMKCQNSVCHGYVPKVYHHDDIYALTVMEDLGDMNILRKGLMNMKKYNNFPKQIGKFMARNLFLTSDFGMGPIEKKNNMTKFINPELCDITERLVLTNPYMNADDNVINENIKEFVASEIWDSKELRLETAKLKTIFLTKAEALLHGDLHTGSIFIDDDKSIIFDAEFAFYGPYSYDIGLLFANIILNYVSWEGRVDKPKKEIENYRKYLLELCNEVWKEFLENFDYLWRNESKDITTKIEGTKDEYIKDLLHETIGFCSCEIMRRIIGMAHVPDLDEIEDLKLRAKAQILGIKISKKLILSRNKINNFNEFIKCIEEINF